MGHGFSLAGTLCTVLYGACAPLLIQHTITAYCEIDTNKSFEIDDKAHKKVYDMIFITTHFVCITFFPLHNAFVYITHIPICCG